jgi:hypothetical protein
LAVPNRLPQSMLSTCFPGRGISSACRSF